MSIVLVVNSGSSSFKYQLIDLADERVLASGLVERIGEAAAQIAHKNPDGSFVSEREIPNHTAGFEAMMEGFAKYGPSLEESPPVAVGHRVVHGGRRFLGPTVVDDEVERDIEDLIPLAPLHNPANLEGIRGARSVFASIPHVAVFDTAFHTTMSDASSLYAIDRETAEKYRVRKYGAHGTSHKYVAETSAAFLGKPVEELKIIVLHIGNGASACAVKHGKSVETSMGMTPLEGLVMGTRSGDIDPAVVFHLHREAGWGVEDLDDFLNRRSGLFGLTGSGDANAQTGLDVYHHRLRHYIGAYLALLGGADVIAFTAGVGENVPALRASALEGMEWLGIEVDAVRNASSERGARVISTDASKTAVLVVPTNEELEIARQTLETAENV